MAVVQISRIQHRKGLQQDLPQLASAEIGWAIDSRRLYIGNGTIAEGAPQVGVTEILTQYSDLLNISDAYTFKGSESGYTSRTGPTTDRPIKRTQQQKLDDYVNVRDFGAKGDGNTNDTAALQRAIDETLFGNFSLATPRLRRIIHIPAGVYIITGSLKIPTYTYLQGEGKGRTIIRQSGSLYPVCQLKDTLAQTDSAYGTNSASYATDITFTDLTLENQGTKDIFTFDSTNRVEMVRVEFKGSKDASSAAVTTAQNGAYLRPTSGTGLISNVMMIECDFNNVDYGTVVNGTDIRMISCNYSNMSRAIHVDTTATAAATRNIKVIGCTFTGIWRSAINVVATSVTTYTNVMSTMNYYGDVGTGRAGAGNAMDYVLSFQGSGNHSVGDVFERPDTDNAQYARVYLPARAVSVGFDANTGITLGMLNMSTGRTITLSASQTNANTGIVFANTTGAATITYWLKRPTASAYRQGTINVIYNGSNIQYQDEYTEYPNATNYVYPGPTGVTFKVLSVSGTTANLSYTSTSSGNADFTYSITTFS